MSMNVLFMMYFCLRIGRPPVSTSTITLFPNTTLFRSQALNFTGADRGRVLYQFALWTVASYDPCSQRRLAAVPASSYDERLHEWRVREALSRSDWPEALKENRAQGDEQRKDSPWPDFEGDREDAVLGKRGAER